jgi:hypothetical protein
MSATAARSTVDAPSLKSADPTITFLAPRARTARARAFGERTPPPTWQGSLPQISRTSASFEPLFIAASRSITFTRDTGESPDPVVESLVSMAQLLSLNELDDFAALQIDAGISMF